ncbi:Replication factor C subunit 2 [Camellia lanceoleosa]|uniref:Replication factor C subunit 2 n=1 Tax=Camellia lanceoleosa TaxID=1840588 RepID=A0ACC0HS21_9ERIC|nr:Replication factor C subunit 2 [Camellia lanceoleosa]
MMKSGFLGTSSEIDEDDPFLDEDLPKEYKMMKFNTWSVIQLISGAYVSDDHGINVVRTKIKNFAVVTIGSGCQGYTVLSCDHFIMLILDHFGFLSVHLDAFFFLYFMGYPCRPFKRIILDEADSMTEDAQAKCFAAYVRNLLQSHKILFHLIIKPLASRCAKFRFKPISEEIMTGRVLHICKQECLNLDSEAFSTLSSVSQGDLCRAMTYLQVISEEVVQALFSACKSGYFDLANKEVNNVMAEGICWSNGISDEQKARICKTMGEVDKDEYLQLLNVASNIMRFL